MPRRPGAPGVAEEAEDGAGTLLAPQRRDEFPSQYPGHQRTVSEGRIDPRKALTLTLGFGSKLGLGFGLGSGSRLETRP